MIDARPFEHCVCQRMANHHDLCEGSLAFAEQGKKVRLALHQGEEAKAIVLDGCVFNDNLPKCDALYLFKSSKRKVAALVELKGAHDIPHAFEQLSYVKHQRPEYRMLVDCLKNDSPGQVIEKAFVVSSGMLTKTAREKLEMQHCIRVSEVLHCEATTPTPDLREYL